jgi:TP901 family phage tail tape measure protein
MPSRLERTLAILITGKDVSATKTIRGVNRELGQLTKAGSKAAGNLSRNLQRGAVIAGGAAVGAIGYAVKAAMDWESAFAGVKKTVDEVDLKKAGMSFESLAADFRKMSTVMPIAAVDIAAIGEEAGALGVKAHDITAFTKTVALLSVTTNLSSEVAAAEMGKLGTILGLTGKQYEEFGDTLVNLGNQGASTESEIVDVTKRWAGQGKQAGLTTNQILALASTITSLGAEPEAGGSSLSRIFSNMGTNIALADKKGQAFAKVTAGVFDDIEKLDKAGKGSHALGIFDKQGDAELDRLQKSVNAGGALPEFLKFLTELGKLDRLDAAKALKGAGITSVRDRNAILLMAQNVGEVTRQLAIAEKSAGALGAEAAKRFETTASKVQTLRNNIHDAAITIGTELLPLVGELAGEATTWIQGHQPEIKQFGKDLAVGIRDAVTWAQKLDWNSIAAALQAGAAGAKAIAAVFMALPPDVKAILAGGFAVNKLTGGLMTDLGKIAFDVFAGRGSSPANPLWVQSIGGAGAAGAAGGAAVGGIGRVASLATKVFLVGAAIGVFSELKGILDEQSARNREQTVDLTSKTTGFTEGAPKASLERSLAGIEAYERRLNSGLGPEQLAFQLNIDGVRTALEEQKALLRAAIANRGPGWQPPPSTAFGGPSLGERDDARAAALAGVRDRQAAGGRGGGELAVIATHQRNVIREQESARREAAANATAMIRAATNDASRIVSAILNLRIPAPAVNVNVTAVAMQRARVTANRTGPKNGSRYQGGGPTEFDL